MMYNNLAVLLLWYIFILIMLHFVYNELYLNNKKIIKEAKKLNIHSGPRTVKEQLDYIIASKKLMIDFPTMFFLTFLSGILFNLFILPFINYNFLFGLFLCLGYSLLYGIIIILIKGTQQNDYYFMIFFLYSLFISVGMLLHKFYNIGINFIVMFGLFIGIYYIIKKLFRLNI